VWAKFQSARTTHTTLLRDELIRTIDWSRASSFANPPANRIEGLVARLIWPGTLPHARDNVLDGDEDESDEMSPEKQAHKRRKKCDAVGSPFRIHALR